MSILWKIYRAVLGLVMGGQEIKQRLCLIMDRQQVQDEKLQHIIDLLEPEPAVSLNMSAGPVEEQP